jgi:hypothetical protein
VLLHHIVDHAAAAAPDTTLVVDGARRWSATAFADTVDTQMGG